MNTYLLLLAIFISSLYGGYNLFIKLSSDHISHVAGAFILQVSALGLGLPLLLYLQTQDRSLKVTKDGIIFSIIAGLLVGLAEILSFYLFEKVNISQGTPIVIGGSVLMGTLLGIFVLHEVSDIFKWVGILLIILGIVMISINPEKIFTFDFTQLPILGGH